MDIKKVSDEYTLFLSQSELDALGQLIDSYCEESGIPMGRTPDVFEEQLFNLIKEHFTHD